MSQQQSWLQSMVQFSVSAAQLWRDHSHALDQVKRSRAEAMEQLRSHHDKQNQNLEANLDLVLDHMRQAASEMV